MSCGEPGLVKVMLDLSFQGLAIEELGCAGMGGGLGGIIAAETVSNYCLGIQFRYAWAEASGAARSLVSVESRKKIQRRKTQAWVVGQGLVY